jgi:transposase
MYSCQAFARLCTINRFCTKMPADKAYLGRDNVRVVELAGGTLFIPFKANTREPTDDSIWTKMYHLFMLNREVFMKHYHKRSNAESAFAMIKGKFGDSVKSKSDTGQVNEVLAKVLCHNVCILCQAIHELGIEPLFTTHFETRVTFLWYDVVAGGGF